MWGDYFAEVIPAIASGHGINRMPCTFVFGSETHAHPSFLCSIVFWLWRRRGMMLLVCGGVSLQDFLVLHDGLLNFLFEPCFLGTRFRLNPGEQPAIYTAFELCLHECQFERVQV